METRERDSDTAKRRRLDDSGAAAGANDACADRLVTDFLLRQAQLRVRVVEEDVDEAAEEKEWARRWRKWAQEEAGGDLACGVDQVLQELGLGLQPETRVVRAPAAQGEGDLTWYKCSDSPRVSTWIDIKLATHVQSTDASDRASVLSDDHDRNAGVGLPGLSQRR